MPKPISQPQSNPNPENRLFEHALSDGHVLKLSLSAEKECKSALTKDGVPVENYLFRSPEKETVAKLCGRVTDPSQVKYKTYGDLVEIGVEDPQQGLHGGGNINFKPAPIQKPKANEPSECKENYSSGYFHLAPGQRKISVSQSVPPPLPTITAMRSTRELALTIRTLAKKSNKTPAEIGTHNDFVKFARESIIKAFEDIKPKTPRIFQELTELVLSNNKDICQDVLETVFAEITGATFEYGNIMLLQALQYVLLETNPAHFNPLQLVQILKNVAGACAKIHSQYATFPELHVHVEVIADTLVTMADAQVRGVSHDDLHDPLYKFLEQVSTDGNLIVFTNKKAQLALEALRCIKHNKTDLDINFHRLVAFAKTVNYIMAAPLDGGIIESIEGVIASLRIAFHKQRKQQEPGKDTRGWYQHFRFLDVLIKNRHWKTFQDEFLKTITALPDSEYPDLLINIVYSLNNIVSSDLENTDDRVAALNMLRAFYKNDGKYSLSALLHSQLARSTDGDVRTKIHEELLREFLDYARFSNVTISTIAKTFLTNVQLVHLKGLTEEAWFRNVGLDTIKIDDLEPLPAKGIAIERTHELLKVARKLNLTSVDAKVRELQIECANPENPAIKPLLAKFSPLLAKDANGKLISTKDAFLAWVNGPQKTAFVESDPGTGKTTMVDLLYYEAWKQAGQFPKTVFVKVPLDVVQHNPNEMIERTLLKYHFSADQLSELKAEYTIVAFCDELEALVGVSVNFYEANKGQGWKLKMWSTGKKDSMHPSHEELLNRHSPKNDRGSVASEFLHLKLQKLEESVVYTCLEKCIEHDPNAPCKQKAEDGSLPYAGWNLERYKQYIGQIPGLFKRMLHPFFLKCVFLRLPAIVELHLKTSPDKPIEVLEIDLIKSNIDSDFERERDKISRKVSNLSPMQAQRYSYKGDFVNRCYQFSQGFAALLDAKKVIALAPNEEEETEEIDTYLGEKNHVFRDACLVFEDGVYKFAEEPFFDYWRQLDIVNGLLGNKRESKHKIFSGQYLRSESMIKLFAETVRRNSRLNDLLQSFVKTWKEQGKSEILGINSQKVLIAVNQSVTLSADDEKEDEEEYEV